VANWKVTSLDYSQRRTNFYQVRLAFAQVVWEHPHILLLDELSIHLDFDSVRALKDALRLFDGSIIIVSHDRYLVKSIIEDDDDDDNNSSENEGIEDECNAKSLRTSTMFALSDKRLERLEDGVDGYERMLKKRVAASTWQEIM
jgi:ATPase subunit of ABC transporter with duplicated ATPase domains